MSVALELPYEMICEDTSKLPVLEWLESRYPYLCSTDAAPACRVSHWKSDYTLAAEKLRMLPEQPDKTRFMLGRLFEGPIMQLWCQLRGFDYAAIDLHRMMRSVAYPFMAANPDGMMPENLGPILEVKTCDSFDKGRWDIGVPEVYRYQAMHLMIVTGRRTCIFIVMFGYTLPVEFHVEWDDDLAESIIEQETAFWEMVRRGELPDKDGSESTLKSMRQRYYETERLKSMELPPEALGLIEQYEVAHGYIKTLGEGENRVKSELLEVLGDAEIGTLNGAVVVTAKKAKDGSRRFKFYDRAA